MRTGRPWSLLLSGWGAVLALALVTSVWSMWGVGELFYEGWGQPVPTLLRYLYVPSILLAFSLLTLTWPRIGGWFLVVFGLCFSVWWTALAANRGWLSVAWVLGTLLPLAGVLVAVGGLFLREHGLRTTQQDDPERRKQARRRLAWQYGTAVCLPVTVALGTSAYFMPLILTRVDDGRRGMRTVEGNGVTLLWAPRGPGWNWRQPWGGYPSWNALARYGVPPVGLEGKAGRDTQAASVRDLRTSGLCRYLSEDGLTLKTAPQHIWRMPTADEIVRSLVHRGRSAGCTWDGRSEEAECSAQPNKDTPLWAPDEPPIYYWSADEFDRESAWYVPYTGGVRYGGAISHQSKSWGNPRHGYRCVRDLVEGGV